MLWDDICQIYEEEDLYESAKKAKAKSSESGLRKWFNQKWVDVSRKKDDGSHPKCGASASKRKGKMSSAYPKCMPARKAASKSEKEKKSMSSHKRSVERKKGGKKPNRTKTSKKKD